MKIGHKNGKFASPQETIKMLHFMVQPLTLQQPIWTRKLVKIKRKQQKSK